eukprot:6348336-Amphidinium_carterae.1
MPIVQQNVDHSGVVHVQRHQNSACSLSLSLVWSQFQFVASHEGLGFHNEQARPRASKCPGCICELPGVAEGKKLSSSAKSFHAHNRVDSVVCID